MGPNKYFRSGANLFDCIITSCGPVEKGIFYVYGKEYELLTALRAGRVLRLWRAKKDLKERTMIGNRIPNRFCRKKKTLTISQIRVADFVRCVLGDEETKFSVKTSQYDENGDVVLDNAASIDSDIETLLTSMPLFILSKIQIIKFMWIHHMVVEIVNMLRNLQ